MTMNPEMEQKLRRSLVYHEGIKKYPYSDTSSPPKITIGIGYNLTDRGIDDDWINTQYDKDVLYFYNQLSTFEWYKHLTQDRQIILIDMCFMGWKKFLTFDQMILAISQGDYEKAAEEMLNSEWASQVKDRATVLAEGMRTGVYEI